MEHSITQIQPVILCGGEGKRLWPLSTMEVPKQFLALHNQHTLFQNTYLRLENLAQSSLGNVLPSLIITSEKHSPLILPQLMELGDFIKNNQVILEPIGKNTAPALTLAALNAKAKNNDPILIICPADHLIINNENFIQAVNQAIDLAKDDHIVTLGIRPTKPETAYGYIQVHKKASSYFDVQQFVEKPNIERARQYLSAGNYFWNSGVFILKTSIWLKAIRQFCPGIYHFVRAAYQNRVEKSIENITFIYPNQADFEKSESQSIDYAVIEKCTEANFSMKMIELTSQWDDLGSFESIWKIKNKNKDGNVLEGNILVKNCHNNLVLSQNTNILIENIDDLIIVETSNGILIKRMNENNTK